MGLVGWMTQGHYHRTGKTAPTTRSIIILGQLRHLSYRFDEKFFQLTEIFCLFLFYIAQADLQLKLTAILLCWNCWDTTPHFLISIPERFNLAIWARLIQAAIPGSVGSSGTSACIQVRQLRGEGGSGRCCCRPPYARRVGSEAAPGISSAASGRAVIREEADGVAGERRASSGSFLSPSIDGASRMPGS